MKSSTLENGNDDDYDDDDEKQNLQNFIDLCRKFVPRRL